MLRGTPGDDVIDGGARGDEIHGLGGNDTICGGGGGDEIFGGPGTDDIEGGAADDKLVGGPDGDSIFGGGGVDEIDGSGGTDSIYGGLEDDVLEGGADPDNVSGSEGNDLVAGGAGPDERLNGGTGSDRLIADDGDKQLLGFDSSLENGARDDDVVDLSHNTTGQKLLSYILEIEEIDTFIGSPHDDEIDPDYNSSGMRFEGRAGDDTFTVFGSDGRPNRVLGGPGNDTVDYEEQVVDLDLAEDRATAPNNRSWGDTLSGIENAIGAGDLRGDDEANFLSGPLLGPEVRAFGRGGDDVLWGSDDADELRGGAGADKIYGRSNLGEGLAFYEDVGDVLKGDAGNDLILGGKGDDTIEGGADNDRLFGFDGPQSGVRHPENEDSIDGGEGRDECDEALDIENCEPVEVCTDGNGKRVSSRSLQDRVCREKIVWSREVSIGDWRVFSTNPDGTGRRALREGQEPELSPDGSKIVFRRFVRLEDRSTNAELFVMDSDGTDVRRLTTTRDHESHATWSPDGRRIAFVRVPQEYSATPYGVPSDIYLMGANGGNVQRLTTDGNEERWNYRDPSWSPDGTRIAYVGPSPGGERWTEINTMNPDGSDKTQVTSAATGHIYGNLQWSPDGTLFLFTACSGSVDACDLYTVGVDGDIDRDTGYSVWRRVTPDEGIYTQGSWSPDGTQLTLMVGNLAGDEYDLATMGSDGSGLTVLFSDGNNEFEPDWGYYDPPDDD